MPWTWLSDDPLMRFTGHGDLLYMLRISRRLLKSILSRRHEVEDRASVAFLLLPGLVAECHRIREVPAVHMLHGLASLVGTMDSDLAFANRPTGRLWRDLDGRTERFRKLGEEAGTGHEAA